MKKLNVYILMSFVLGVLSLPLEGVDQKKPITPGTQSTSKSATSQAVVDDEYDILERNEIDDTDVLAIPFDDSEVEDEEEINRAEKKEVFKLPHSR